MPLATQSQLVSLESPGAESGRTSIEVATSPDVACCITVRYEERPSQIAALGDMRADGEGRVPKSWSVDPHESGGSWSITVTCESEPLDIAIRSG